MRLLLTIEELLRGRREPPMRPSPGHAMGGPDEDDEFLQKLDPIPEADVDGLTIGISYLDGGGRPSIRTIRCDRAYRDGPLVYIHAWCLMRENWRTFRLDRIDEIYDYRTGELLGDPMEFFTPRLGKIEQYRKTWPSGNWREGARVLLFLALSDGNLHDMEREVIIAYACGRAGNQAPGYRRSVSHWVDNQVPTKQGALAGVRHAFDDPDDAAELASALFDVMLADGQVTDEELLVMRSMVGSMERREKRNGR